MLLITGKVLQRQNRGTNMVKREALQDNSLRFFPKSPRNLKLQSCQDFVAHARIIVKKCS